MFCKYCGKQIKDGEICSCRQSADDRTVKIQRPGQAQSAQNQGQAQRGQHPRQAQGAQSEEARRAQYERARRAQQAQREQAQRAQQMQQERLRMTEPERRPESSGEGKGLVFASFACSALMLVLFILLRFVLKDLLTDSVLESVYPYLIYIVPLIFGIAALIMAVFSLKDQKIRSLSLIGMIVSVLFIAGIFVSMIVLPYEPDTYSSLEDDDEEDPDEEEESDDRTNTDDQTDAEDGEKAESESGSGDISAIEQDYKDGKLDYVQAKAALNELNIEELEGEDAEKVITLQETLETDLDSEMKTLAVSSDYKEILQKLSDMRQASVEEDEFLEELASSYEAEYILYLDEERQKLLAEDKKDEAVKMLEEAQLLVEDRDAVGDMIMETQKAVGAGEYVIPDSNSRVLTDADVAGLTIQQINYAKNEIYARHGRKFKSNELQTYFNSKSWYNGTIEASAFNANALSDIEKKNAEFLSKIEFSMQSGGYKLDAQ